MPMAMTVNLVRGRKSYGAKSSESYGGDVAKEAAS